MLALLLAAFGAHAAADAEFAGPYQVGATRCSVRPIKMAYEVRCPRSAAPRIYFYSRRTPAGGVVLVSQGASERRHRFEFAAETLDAGRFVRADGKVFRVRRIAATLPERGPK